MNEPSTVIRCTPIAKTLLILLIVTISLLLVYYDRRLIPLRIPIAFVVPVLVAAIITLGLRLISAGESKLPLGCLLGGCLITLSGIVADMAATVVNTPNLEREGNVIARTFLDAGYSVSFVYAYGLIAQGLLAVCVCVLWVALLAHRGTIIESALADHSRSRPDFVKAALGGSGLTWRQCFFPMKISEFPRAYQGLFLATACLMGTGFFRWYLALAWMGFCQFGHSIAVTIASMMTCLLLYLIWILGHYRPVERL
jgi:hypothetical protein